MKKAIEIWGDSKQTRSFLIVDECIEETIRLMRFDIIGPLNIGSDEMVTINQLLDLATEISGKKIQKKYIKGAEGVGERNSENKLIREKLGWAPSNSLERGLGITYSWILKQIYNAK
jgi:GDP-D-mannose 3',5'-epimerase